MRDWRRESGYFIANNVLNSASAYLETILIGALLGLDEAGVLFRGAAGSRCCSPYPSPRSTPSASR
jgi:O-antigen/teichoic acid export membrane protein